MIYMHLASGTWTIGDPLPNGEGGFGKVYHVTSPDGASAVAKFVTKDPGADRELLMGDSLRASNARNVIPVWDSGEHDGQFVLVMPKADTSLAEHLAATDGPLPTAEVIDILRDVAIALQDLASLDPAVVHRDLKPANVLRLESAWSLADFGIARYAEATTAIDTRKWNMRRPYAAPEQWRLERAIPATDVYAFGVMAYELLTGRRPFLGPDFRSQHLGEAPPPLTAGTPRLRTLVEECLFKEPAARPSAANIVARLEGAGQQPSSLGASRLARANRAQSERLARDYAEAVRLAEDQATNARLFEVAKQSFDTVATALRSTIEADAPLASIHASGGRGTMAFVADLGKGKVGVSLPAESTSWDGPFRVVAHAAISVNQTANRGYQGRSHSLWFADAQEEGRFAWYEVAFMSLSFGGGSAPSLQPFSLDPAGASSALSPAMTTEQLAWPFEEIDRADLSEFVDRWIGWFADAVEGRMQFPSQLPEKSTTGSFRRP